MREENKDEGYSLTWETLKPDWPLWVIIGGLFGGAVFIHLKLPGKMPLSWALFEPVMILGLYLLMLLLPLLDPWRKNYARFSSVYRLFRWLMFLFMSGVCILSKAEVIGCDLETEVIINAGIALLFIITGNVMGQIRPNFFVGIRVPWTLANEEVWRRTHRLAAKLWVAGGLICFALAPGTLGHAFFCTVYARNSAGANCLFVYHLPESCSRKKDPGTRQGKRK